MDEPFGQNAVGVLLVQDMAIVPMMIVLTMLGDSEIQTPELIKQLVGGVLILAGAISLMKTGILHIPLFLKGSIEKRVLLGLSAGLGAFLAGMILASSDQADWVHEHLESVYVIFVMIFFLSVGMMVDADYLVRHIWLVVGATGLVFLFNSGVNVFVMRALGENWRMALITGGLLSQIGEFSFLLAAVGAHSGILSDTLHELTVIVIAMTLLFSPLWMMMTKWLAKRQGLLPRQ